MSLLIVDSSFALAWCFEDEVNPRAEQLLDQIDLHDLLTLPLWRWEVTNALLMAEKRKRITTETAAAHALTLQELAIDYDDGWKFDLQKLLELARQHKLTIYDAAYLELAIRRRASLATLDSALEKAARDAGISIV